MYEAVLGGEMVKDVAAREHVRPSTLSAALDFVARDADWYRIRHHLPPLRTRTNLDESRRSRYLRSNWELVELYRMYRCGAPVEVLMKRYHMRYMRVLAVIDRVELEAAKRGMHVKERSLDRLLAERAERDAADASLCALAETTHTCYVDASWLKDHDPDEMSGPSCLEMDVGLALAATDMS